MRLHRVQIRNFKSIEDIEVVLDPSCRILVGVNETGKTNILRALALLDPANPPRREDIRRPTAKPITEAFVRYIFRFSEHELSELHSKACRWIWTDESDRAIVVIDGGRFDLAALCQRLTEGFYEVNVLDGKRRFGLLEEPDVWTLTGGWTVPPAGSPPETFGQEEDGIGGSYQLIGPDKTDAVRDDFKELVTEATPLHLWDLLNRVTRERIEEELPDCILWRVSPEDTLRQQVNLADFLSDPSEHQAMLNMLSLANIQVSQLEDARRNSVELQSLLDRAARAATEQIRKLWKAPGRVEIYLKSTDDYIETGVQDDLNRFEFSLRSEGFKRFVSFLLEVSVRARSGSLAGALLLFDDPETGLHPPGARSLRDDLIRIADDNQVLFSTHSVFMIDTKDTHRHLIVEKQEEVTTVREVKDSAVIQNEVLFRALGSSAVDLLAERVLVMEGQRDRDLLTIYIDRVLREGKRGNLLFHAAMLLKSTNICAARGVKYIETFANWLGAMQLNRVTLIVTDSDSEARRLQIRFRSRPRADGANWLRCDEVDTDYRPVTLDDYLVDERIRHAVKRWKEIIHLDHEIGPAVTGTGALREAKRWLQSHLNRSVDAGRLKEEVARRLVCLKDELYDSLQPKDIRPEFGQFLINLAGKFEGAANDASQGPGPPRDQA